MTVFGFDAVVLHDEFDYLRFPARNGGSMSERSKRLNISGVMPFQAIVLVLSSVTCGRWLMCEKRVRRNNGTFSKKKIRMLQV